MEQTLIKRVKRVLEHEGSILDFYSDYMELPDGKTEKCVRLQINKFSFV